VVRCCGWFDTHPDRGPDRLIFIIEIWASTTMPRTHGRALRSERLRAVIPHFTGKITIFVARPRNSGMGAPMVLGGPISGACLRHTWAGCWCPS
jgi:hypothetical protein